jgi:hypothetical protein
MKQLMLLAGLWCLQPAAHAAPGNSHAKYDATPVNVRDRAMSHFKENYAWVVDAAWYTTPGNNLYCFFHQGNIVNRVFYDKHGDWEYTLLSYPPSVLPKSVEKLIHGSFGGYRISFANEIRRPGQDPYYVVNIENANHIKVIQVEGDQIDIRQSLIKG